MPPNVLTKWGLFNMTDTELRAELDAILLTHIRGHDNGKGEIYFTLESAKRALESLLKAQLTAERTAIKAALPEKRKYTQYGSLGFSVDADNRTKGYNQALTDVTQVIDGREGV